MKGKLGDWNKGLEERGGAGAEFSQRYTATENETFNKRGTEQM